MPVLIVCQGSVKKPGEGREPMKQQASPYSLKKAFTVMALINQSIN